MGMARLSNRYIPDLPPSNFPTCYFHVHEDGTVVHVHAPSCRANSRGVSICSGMRWGLDEADGLLHATRSGLVHPNED